MLARVLTETIGVCRFRRSPEHFPFSPVLALALLVVLQVLKVLNSQQLAETDLALPSALIAFVFALVSTWLVLRLCNVAERYWQTLLALTATGVVFALLALPVAMMIGPLPPLVAGQPVPVPPLPFWLFVALGAWRLMVSAHIWRHALAVPLPVGVLVVVGLFLVELLAQRMLLSGILDAMPAAAGNATT